GSVASGATWMDNTYINVYLSDGAKYTVTGLSCMDGDNYLRYYGYDAATDGNGTVSVKNGTTDVTSTSTGYKTTTYTFTATPASGYRFVNWTKGAGGEVLGTDASINVTCEQNGQYQVYANFEQDAPAGTALTPDATRKVWTLDAMPGGNVTLEPEYYPQATVAEGAVTAADADARATTDDPLVKVDATKLTGAKKLMYFVSNSGTTAPAYDAEGWTDQLPTAEGFTQQGIVYVWYYPVGTDEGIDDATATYSDGDICLQSITARIAAAPTYAVEFAEGTEESDKWTASPNADVEKGETVTVTYTGSKKVIGVKAEKKAGAAGIVNPVVGQIIGSDGKNYDANATLPDGVTAAAMIAYVSGSNGLALALTDISDYYTWDNSAPSNNGKTAPEICSALNTSKAVTGGTWKLPSQDEWKQMFSANGGNEGSYTGLNTAIGNAGGTALLENDDYWSSSEVDESYAWLVNLADGNASWNTYGKHYSRCVRACLAF
ncbi:MAG: DUF1566 domain-containing protein, partial [Prevotella sp.]|nr:DUF1566 domain-containing protein [Prevotella sp.]